MSLQSIIGDSSREVLLEMLAPEIADGLARRIVERAMGRVDEAVGDFFGSDYSKEVGGKRRATKSKANTRPNLGDFEENGKSIEMGEAKPENDSEDIAA